MAKRHFLFLIALLPAFVQAQKVGLVLSGGGALGMAHIGAIRALEENNIPIDYITGTSAGAMIGGFYAAGYSPDELYALMLEEGTSWLAPGLSVEEDFYYQKKEPDGTFINVPINFRKEGLKPPSSLFSDAEINYGLAKHMSRATAVANNDFDSLMVPFRCVTADILERRTIIMSEGALPFAVRASMAVPVFFPPAKHEEHPNLFDGGIYDNFPVGPMEDIFEPDFIIGVDVTLGRGDADAQKRYKTNFFRQVISHNIDSESWRKMPDNSIFIAPDLAGMSGTDFNTAKMIFAVERGYQATMACMADIKKAVKRRADQEALKKRRARFMQPRPLVIGKVEINDEIVRAEQIFVRNLMGIHPGDTLTFKDIRQAYSRLRGVGNYMGTFPELIWNEQEGNFTLRLFLKPSTRLELNLGGAFFTPTDHQLQLKAAFQTNQIVGLKGEVDVVRGSYLNHLGGLGSVYFPTRYPLTADLEVGITQRDYQLNTFNVFASENRANVYNQTRYFRPSISLPLKGRSRLEAAYNRLYLQDFYFLRAPNGSERDPDETTFLGNNVGLNYTRSTLNKKTYPTEGSLLDAHVSYWWGEEAFRPESPRFEGLTKPHDWGQLNVKAQRYLVLSTNLRFGLGVSGAFSTLTPMATDTASTLYSPKFQPLSDSPILFLPQLYSKLYVAFSNQWSYRLTKRLFTRMELHYMQSFDERGVDNTGEVQQSFKFSWRNRAIAGMAGLIYDSRVGPIGAFCHYYENGDNSFRFLMHVGYMIFRDHPLH